MEDRNMNVLEYQFLRCKQLLVKRIHNHKYQPDVIFMEPIVNNNHMISCTLNNCISHLEMKGYPFNCSEGVVDPMYRYEDSMDLRMKLIYRDNTLFVDARKQDNTIEGGEVNPSLYSTITPQKFVEWVVAQTTKVPIIVSTFAKHMLSSAFVPCKEKMFLDYCVKFGTIKDGKCDKCKAFAVVYLPYLSTCSDILLCSFHAKSMLFSYDDVYLYNPFIVRLELFNNNMALSAYMFPLQYTSRKKFLKLENMYVMKPYKMLLRHNIMKSQTEDESRLTIIINLHQQVMFNKPTCYHKSKYVSDYMYSELVQCMMLSLLMFDNLDSMIKITEYERHQLRLAFSHNLSLETSAINKTKVSSNIANQGETDLEKSETGTALKKTSVGLNSVKEIDEKDHDAQNSSHLQDCEHDTSHLLQDFNSQDSLCLLREPHPLQDCEHDTLHLLQDSNSPLQGPHLLQDSQDESLIGQDSDVLQGPHLLQDSQDCDSQDESLIGQDSYVLQEPHLLQDAQDCDSQDESLIGQDSDVLQGPPHLLQDSQDSGSQDELLIGEQDSDSQDSRDSQDEFIIPQDSDEQEFTLYPKLYNPNLYIKSNPTCLKDVEMYVEHTKEVMGIKEIENTLIDFEGKTEQTTTQLHTVHPPDHTKSLLDIDIFASDNNIECPSEETCATNRVIDIFASDNNIERPPEETCTTNRVVNDRFNPFNLDGVDMQDILFLLSYISQYRRTHENGTSSTFLNGIINPAFQAPGTLRTNPSDNESKTPHLKPPPGFNVMHSYNGFIDGRNQQSHDRRNQQKMYGPISGNDATHEKSKQEG